MSREYTEHKLFVGHLTINYVDAGSGQPLLFLHNGGGFWQIWKKQIDYFSGSHRVIALDWPGFGESSETAEMLSLELLTTTLKKFIELKQLDNCILIGNCIGASAALNYANHHPEKVKKLILFNICPGKLLFGNRMQQYFFSTVHKSLFLKNMTEPLLAFIFTKTKVKYRFPSILFGYPLHKNDFLVLKYKKKFLQQRQTNARLNLLFSVFTFTLSEMKKKDRHFTNYLVWGENNKVTTLKKHFEHHRSILLPEKHFIVENGGHLCMYDESVQTNDIINQILMHQ